LRNLDNLFTMLDILGDNVQHNIPPTDIPRLVAQFRNLKGSDIDSLKLEGTSTRMGPQNLWYILVDEAERQRIHDELVARMDTEPDVQAGSDAAPSLTSSANQQLASSAEMKERAGENDAEHEKDRPDWLDKLNELWGMFF